MVVTENYPQLKSDQNFRDLQAQLEGTENRITVARNRYIQAVQDYNITVRSFPEQPDGDDVRLQAEAEFHGRERSGDFQAAERRFRRRPSRLPWRRRPQSPAHWPVCGAPRQRRGLPGRAGRDAPQVAVPPLTGRGSIDLTGTLSGGAVNRIETKLADLRGQEGQPDRRAMRAHDAARGNRAVRHPGRRRVEARAQGRRRRRRSCWSRRTTGACASRSGNGLEGALPDAIANRIVDETIAPHFKLGRLRRRRRGGGRSDHRGGQRRAAAGARPEVGAPRNGSGNLLAVAAGGRHRRERRAARLVRPTVRIARHRRPRRSASPGCSAICAHRPGCGHDRLLVRDDARLIDEAGRRGGGWGAASAAVSGRAAAAASGAGAALAAAAADSAAAAPRAAGNAARPLDSACRRPRIGGRACCSRKATLDAIEEAIARAERTHAGEIRFVIETSLSPLARPE